MAISNKKFLLQTSLLAFITMFLMPLNKVSATNSLSFTFNKFSADQKDLIFQGNATVTNNLLQLTKLESDTVGRALFSAPVRLWKSPTVMANIETNFTFQISAPLGYARIGDGLAFFIASHDTHIPPNSTGKFLGLFPNNIIGFRDKIVAVEFDTFSNPEIGDPSYKHIGIDVHSVESKKETVWQWQNGKVGTAQISYNSVSKKLSVFAAYPGFAPVKLSYDIALYTVLPEWVRVGFSASTGDYKQTTNILSWSFTSSLGDKFVQMEEEEEDVYIASVA